MLFILLVLFITEILFQIKLNLRTTFCRRGHRISLLRLKAGIVREVIYIQCFVWVHILATRCSRKPHHSETTQYLEINEYLSIYLLLRNQQFLSGPVFVQCHITSIGGIFPLPPRNCSLKMLTPIWLKSLVCSALNRSVKSSYQKTSLYKDIKILI